MQLLQYVVFVSVQILGLESTFSTRHLYWQFLHSRTWYLSYRWV